MFCYTLILWLLGEIELTDTQVRAMCQNAILLSPPDFVKVLFNGLENGNIESLREVARDDLLSDVKEFVEEGPWR
jgi:hypothetical protein